MWAPNFITLGAHMATWKISSNPGVGNYRSPNANVKWFWQVFLSQVLAILASWHVCAKYDNLLLDSWCNKINSPKSIECDLLIACSDKIVSKHKFLFKLSLVFCCGHHHSFYGNTKNLRDCPDLGCYFLIVSD